MIVYMKKYILIRRQNQLDSSMMSEDL